LFVCLSVVVVVVVFSPLDLIFNFSVYDDYFLSHSIVLALAWNVSQDAALSYCPEELKYILALKRGNKQLTANNSGLNTSTAISSVSSHGGKSSRDSAKSAPQSASTSPAKSGSDNNNNNSNVASGGGKDSVCRLCTEPLFFAVTVDCGQSHRFCFACLFNALPQLTQCPTCKQKITRALNC
jgi:hypothetical protein